jgi:hypothetical protein
LKISICCAAALFLGGCSGAEPSLAPFTGCYKPLLHPGLDPANRVSSERDWMRFDTLPEPRATGRKAYRVEFDKSLLPVHLFTGWWRPVSRDSIELVWSTGTFSQKYLMRRSGDTLIGRIISSNDLGDSRELRQGVTTVRQDPHATSCQSPPVR